MFLNFDLLSTSSLTLGIIFLAEIGDKSQLVCMSLAAKHKSKPILLGATLAFSLLNLLAVLFGGSLTLFIPQEWLTITASALFILFGVHSLFAGDEQEDDEDEQVSSLSNKNILFMTFLMIFLAELGDKTQLAVVTMSTTYDPISVWLGATVALVMTSALGIFAGRKILTRLQPELLHKVSGLLFIGVGSVMLAKLFL